MRVGRMDAVASIYRDGLMTWWWRSKGRVLRNAFDPPACQKL